MVYSFEAEIVKQKRNFVNWYFQGCTLEKETPHSLSSAFMRYFTSVSTRRLRLTCTGLHKMSCYERDDTTGCYVILRYVTSGTRIIGTIHFSKMINSHRYITHNLVLFLNTSPIMRTFYTPNANIKHSA